MASAAVRRFREPATHVVAWPPVVFSMCAGGAVTTLLATVARVQVSDAVEAWWVALGHLSAPGRYIADQGLHGIELGATLLRGVI